MRLTTLFNKIHSVRVALLGDFMIDVYTTGSVSRISPEAPVPVLKACETHRLPGGAGNVALNLRALGATVKIAGRVGCDEEGRYLRSLLHEEGIEVEGLVQDPTFQTSVKHRLLAGSQQLIRIDTEEKSPLSEMASAQTLSFLHHLIDDVDVVAISDYGKGFLTDEILREVIHWGKEKGRTVIIDPKGSDFSKYAGATIIKPNLKEAYEAADMEVGSPLDEVADKIFATCGCSELVITRSEKGISLFSSKGREDFPVVVKEVSDVTGAGDTALAAIAFALAAGLTSTEAMELANVASGIAVQHVGCARVGLSEIAGRLVELNSSNKVYNENHLFALTQVLKEMPYRLVSIEGESFDLLQFYTALKGQEAGELTILYIKEEALPAQMIDLLTSIDQIDSIILGSEGIAQLCNVIQPESLLFYEDGELVSQNLKIGF